jgi:hypothetical protein
MDNVKLRQACFTVVGFCLVLGPFAPACVGLGGTDDPVTDPYQPVGASARDLLTGDRFKSLVVEIQAVQGFEPSTQSLKNLTTFLEDRLNKPNGIRIVLDPSLPSSPASSPTYSTTEIRAIEKKHRILFTQGSEMAAYLLFLDGSNVDDTPAYNTLGQAYWNTSLAIFESTVRRVAVQTGHSTAAYTTSETIVLLHEFSHVLGLVNNGTPLASPHQDSGHGAHCNNPQCLMHYEVENGALARGFVLGEVPSLDGSCLNDLRANGGR